MSTHGAQKVARDASDHAMSIQEDAARIVGLHVSRGGVPKLAIGSGNVSRLGLEGDVQKNRKYHGGPERALCLYSRDVMDVLQAEGHPIAPGTTGENVLLQGLDWDLVRPGARLRLGLEVLIEISDYTRPCKQITASFKDGFFMRAWEKRFSGQSRVYARVLCEGTIRVGDVVTSIQAAP